MQILKLKIKLESGQEVELTLEEARNLFLQLGELFSNGNDNEDIIPFVPTPFPIIPAIPMPTYPAPETPYWQPFYPQWPSTPCPQPTYPIITCQVGN